MKKSLWMAAAAMVVGCGISAHAVTNGAFGQWTFEGLAAGTEIPSTAGVALDDPYGTWSADTNNGIAYITNETPTGVDTFLTNAHEKALYFDGSVTNHFDINALEDKRFITDFLLKPGQLEDLSLLNQVGDDARLAFYFDTSSNFNLMHGDAGVWTTSTFTSVQYETNAWVRITIEQDYASSINYIAPGFAIWINGVAQSHANGRDRTGEGPYDFAEEGPGTWFQMKEATTEGVFGMNALVGMGIGVLDDVVNYEYGVVAQSLFAFAQTFNSAFGVISPSGTVEVVDGTPQTFTLTVADGVAAYVTGLKIGETQYYTNDLQNVKTQQWNVTYALLNAYGTNVTALFAAKDSTTAQWLTNSFTIGNGGDYATFDDAEAGDYDGDGFSNLAEAIVGTDPKDNTSYLKITGIALNELGNIVVSFQGSALGANVDYNLFASDDVDGTYASIGTTAKAGGPLSIIVTPNTPKKFYKVVVPYTGE